MCIFLDSEQREKPEQDFNLEQLRRAQETLQNDLDALREQSKNHLILSPLYPFATITYPEHIPCTSLFRNHCSFNSYRSIEVVCQRIDLISI